MGRSYIPSGYAPHLSLYQTQSAISLIKRVFQDALARELLRAYREKSHTRVYE